MCYLMCDKGGLTVHTVITVCYNNCMLYSDYVCVVPAHSILYVLYHCRSFEDETRAERRTATMTFFSYVEFVDFLCYDFCFLLIIVPCLIYLLHDDLL